MAVSVTALLGNALVIFAVVWNRRLRTVPNILFINLAVADLMQGALAIPLRLAEMWNQTERRPIVPCLAVIPLTVLFYGASNLNLMLISIDRHFCLTRPFLYQCVVTPAKVAMVIGVTWVLMLVIALLPVVGWGASGEASTTDICLFYTTLSKEYLLALFSFINIFVDVVLVFTNFFILKVARKHARQIGSIRGNALTDGGVMTTTNDELSNFPRQLPNIPRLAPNDPRQSPNTLRRGLNDQQQTLNNQPQEPKNQRQPPNNQRQVAKNQLEESRNKRQSPDNQKRAPNNQRQVSNSQRRATNRRHEENRAAMVVVITVGAFIVLTTPITVIDILGLLGCHDCSPLILTKIAVGMVYSNACINVFIYAGYNTNMRRTWVQAYGKIRRAAVRRTSITQNGVNWLKFGCAVLGTTSNTSCRKSAVPTQEKSFNTWNSLCFRIIGRFSTRKVLTELS